MCDCYTPAGEPIPTNKRYNAAKVFSHPDVVAEEPWYGIEQEYTLLQKDVKWPLGWPVGGFPDKSFGRDIVDAHYKACLYAGINISGINGEWEFQVGPSIGISAGDQIWVARYILEGVANRGASIRVGRETEQNGKGYFEDRRPASNMDPYVVTSMIAETTILWKP
ncbi:hypothetical protein B296_00045698 [Ensete ventricosum]|uniref:glutamine synthetase n=1 Tax=Ensete ventricosum TaxID=4639 RepID=A0A426Z6M3_ENSVE|nr:hypothetical protein B296_00045698 [Ensete ventricosum]